MRCGRWFLCDPDTDTYTDGYSDTDRYSDGYNYGYANAETDTYAQICANPETSSHTSPQTIV